MRMDKDLNRPLVSDRMSERLITIAKMLGGSRNNPEGAELEPAGKGLRVADVGCDHGYISIYLVQSGIAASAIAMDVRKGPLSGAKANIEGYGLENAITTRLSDGLKELSKGEADSLVIAGMGGKLMMRILEDGDPESLGIRLSVLQPQSELSDFRQYLREKGYRILEEKIVFEDGKYYFPMKVGLLPKNELKDGTDAVCSSDVFEQVIDELIAKAGCDKKIALSICNRFGEYNIYSKDPLLKKFCEHGIKVTGSILKSLDKSGHKERFEEVQSEYDELEKVLQYLG